MMTDNAAERAPESSTRQGSAHQAAPSRWLALLVLCAWALLAGAFFAWLLDRLRR